MNINKIKPNYLQIKFHASYFPTFNLSSNTVQSWWRMRGLSRQGQFSHFAMNSWLKTKDFVRFAIDGYKLKTIANTAN